jgi:hypothetical protein
MSMWTKKLNHISSIAISYQLKVKKINLYNEQYTLRQCEFFCTI